MTDRAGSALPLHPDAYGHPFRPNLVRDYDEGILGALTEAEMAAMWEQEQEFRASAATTLIVKRHRHGCGHNCTSGACVVLALLKDQHCPTCQEAMGL